jgi:hypothetical protein
MAHPLSILAGDRMQTYRARNPRKSPLWQCVHRHFDEFLELYPVAYQPRYGSLRPVIPEVVRKFLDCGNLERGFARIRCDHCQHEYLLAFSCKSRWFCPSCQNQAGRLCEITQNSVHSNWPINWLWPSTKKPVLFQGKRYLD